MPQRPAFQSDEHENQFREQARHFYFGAPSALTCGARTRVGGACTNPPIKEGKGRCLSHCGPHAARAFRERQKRRFEAGSITATEWNRAEGRRAANRLSDKWKNDPWHPGSTIDLADHEHSFRVALGDIDINAVPPAVVDWLRWRYRRTQIDKCHYSAWVKARLEDLPARIAQASEKPAQRSMGSTRPEAPSQIWKVGQTGGVSRRSLPDKPKAPPVIRGKGYTRPGRPRTRPANTDELEDLQRIYRENATALVPVMERAQGELKQLAALRTLRDYLSNPRNAAAHRRWMDLVVTTVVR